MKALVYHGPGLKSWDTVDDPKPIEPTDIVVRIDTTTICGTDLHILKGDVPAVTDGRVLGHEAVGTVVELGSAVNTLAVDDRVIIPAITSCGRCANCKRAMPSHCLAVGGIGWIFGHLIDGTQAEYTRVPYAETLNGNADDVEARIAALTTAGLGADVAIEAVGVPQTFDLCTRAVRPGGVVANIGVHGTPTTLHLEDLWIKNITITTGLVDGTTVPMLLQLVRSGKVAGELFGTHEFGLNDMMSAYETFANAAETNALKVVIKR